MGKLDSEEKAILAAFEAGKLKPVKNRARELARHCKAARATIVNGKLVGQTVKQLNKHDPRVR